MKIHTQCLLAALLCCCAAWGQGGARDPHIGYVYPAGGQVGATFEVLAGGQFLRGVQGVHITGDGVHATVVKRYPPFRNLDGDQRRELGRRLRRLWNARWDELPHEQRPPGGMGFRLVGGRSAPEDEAPVELPPHPLLDRLEEMGLRELQHVLDVIANFRKRQLNTQLAEVVRLEVTIADDAAPGDRELRLVTHLGLTNPMCFQVGALPEIREEEPNGQKPPHYLPEGPVHDVPALLNGQIMPGDIDRFRLRLRRGQRLVFDTRARHLVPYLADAVPGWFQATLALYGPEGEQLAYTDDYRHHPDPVLFYEIPGDGVYTLEIRDAIYRGREDFVYRIAASGQPFITGLFPLGGQRGERVKADVAGWNLPKDRMRLDTRGKGSGIRRATLRAGGQCSNAAAYAVGALPEVLEVEPNNLVASGQALALPGVANGRIAEPGDADVYTFEGRAGQTIVAELTARRLGSPLDALLEVLAPDGGMLAMNDDHMVKDGHLHTGPGLLTHYADPYLRIELPENGVYAVRVTDIANHGGLDWAYRLRVSPPRPDFRLRVTPASVSVPPGRAAPIEVHVLRLDGFDGAIGITLEGAPPGFVLDGGRIPAGCERTRMTISAPRRPLPEPVSIRLTGRARAAGEDLARPVEPAENMMQAFLWRHLAPARELMLASVRRGRGPMVRLASETPARIPPGGAAEVRVRVPRAPKLENIELALDNPPDGLSAKAFTPVPEGFTFQLCAADDAPGRGWSGNVIVEAFGERQRQTKDGATRTQRISLGVLPAVPVEIVRP